MNIPEILKSKNFFYKILLICIAAFGIYLRTKLYITSSMLEDDECRLAIGIMDKNLLQMFLPIGSFSSSPLFLFVSKIIAEISDYNEYALKFISYISSIVSVVFFYKLCAQYFKRKASILLSSLLFTVNNPIIYFSSIFKTYSIDVLISILCLYYLPQINIQNITKKQLIFLSVLIAAMPLLSLPMLFFIGVFFLINLYENYKNKSFYKKFAVVFIPFLAIFLLYYIFNLQPTKVMQLNDYQSFWDKVFSAPLIINIILPFKFIFVPNKYTLMHILLIISSLICTIFYQKERTKTNFYLFAILFSSIILSYLNLYPIVIGRTALYLIPILILIIIKPLDIIDIKNKLFYLICLIFYIGFYSYFLPSFYKDINDVKNTFRHYASKSLFYEMKNKFNFNTDEIVMTEASAYMYTFYAVKTGLDVKWQMPEFKDKNIAYKKSEYIEYLNNLSPDKNYWFYLIKEFDMTPQRKYVLEWLEGQNIVYYKKERDSYLYYITPPFVRKNP